MHTAHKGEVPDPAGFLINGTRQIVPSRMFSHRKNRYVWWLINWRNLRPARGPFFLKLQVYQADDRNKRKQADFGVRLTTPESPSECGFWGWGLRRSEATKSWCYYSRLRLWIWILSSGYQLSYLSFVSTHYEIFRYSLILIAQTSLSSCGNPCPAVVLTQPQGRWLGSGLLKVGPIRRHWCVFSFLIFSEEMSPLSMTKMFVLI